ncbi:MAG: hypothetical protein IJM78_03185 [Prevotella sp.]|nr:hypothetical protein [Prevotella sp.]
MKRKKYIKPYTEYVPVNTEGIMQVISGVEGTTDLTPVIDDGEGTDQALARHYSVWEAWEDTED